MPMTEASLTRLRELLQRCSAHVRMPDGTSQGSGFFIDERLVLTCAHVVKRPKGTVVTVQPFRREPRTGTILEIFPDNTEDLALIEVDATTEADPQPAVLLDDKLTDNIDYYAVGFPKDDLYGDVGLEERKYTGTARKPIEVSPVSLLSFQAGGPAITKGLSGGAVLHSDSGAVVAVVQYSADQQGTAGGGAIPVLRAADRFDAVKERLRYPPMATREWRDAIGRDRWVGLGKPWGWNSTLELYISGSRSKWQVRVDPDDEVPYEVTVKNLPDEVSEALFRWAQRGRVRDVQEVKLLGRLLAGALFPPSVAQRMATARQADELLIRLRFEEETTLMNVPWEFATVSVNGQDKHVAVEPGVSFLRVADHPDDATVRIAPKPPPCRVLGIVVQPSGWQDMMPKLEDGDQEVNWPKEGELLANLRLAVQSQQDLSFVQPEDPTPAAIEELVATADMAPFDVVHYVGFGRRLMNGEAGIAVSDGLDDVEWRSLNDLFEWAAAARARMLVVEFALPRATTDPEPIRPDAFLPGLRDTVNAVVFTQLPVHPKQFHIFNSKLYKELNAGRPVESAVQAARGDASKNRMLADAACFGWFTLVTGRQPYMCLVTPSDRTRGVAAPRYTAEPGPESGKGQFEGSTSAHPDHWNQ
jgi:Trypsin-like peptidase domain